MIVCSCTEITSKDIEEAVAALRTTDPFVVLTPGLIYRQLCKRPSCGTCLPLISKLMLSFDEEGPACPVPAVTTLLSRTASLNRQNRS
jgi:bacterioferritin-associated ferredoxin